MDQPDSPSMPAGGPEPLDLATAYAELHNLVLDGPDVAEFLHELAVLAAAIVPGSHCGITLRRDTQLASVASNDDVAMRMDETQYLRGRGPCLEAMSTSQRVEVRDMAVEDRWGDYAAHALANDIHSVVSLPIRVDGDSIGALNLFSSTTAAFAEPDVARAQAFTTQAATALTILLRQASRISLDDQLRDALATRATIDQALGVLMHAQQINAGDAFEILRHASQTSNRKVSVIAADIIESMTGHPAELPRPLSDRS
jgi:GAF domain-containing protein